jgi:LysM repeat protein
MRRSLAALVLALVLPLPTMAAEQYVVKPGETLSEIAERQGVSTSRLMQLNGIKDADLVVTGTRLRLPGSQPSAEARSGRGNYTVKPGETLSEIAESQGISLKRLMDLNGIQQADHVEAGSRIVVPGAPGSSVPAKPAVVNRNAREHVVQPGETLSGIADRYGIPMSQLVASNAITSPNHVEAGTRLALRSSAATSQPAPAKPAKPAIQPSPKSVSQPAAKAVSKPMAKPAAPAAANPVVAAKPASGGAPDWRSYGPLQVDFANWQPLGGSQVAPALNSKGQQIFLAVNCGARKLNSTGEAGTWKSWDQPQSDFEERLMVDACKAPAG